MTSISPTFAEFLKNSIQVNQTIERFESLDKNVKQSCVILSYAYADYSSQERGIFKTPEKAVKFLESINKNERFINEVLLAERRTKPYFDVEFISQEHPNVSKSQLFKSLIVSIDKAVSDLFALNDIQREFSRKSLAISNCHRKTEKGTKISYRIVINAGLHFKCVADAKIFAEKIKKMLVLPDALDLSVYCNNRLMRTLNQHKPRDECPTGFPNEPFKLQDKCTAGYKDFLIQAVPEDSIEIKTILGVLDSPPQIIQEPIQTPSEPPQVLTEYLKCLQPSRKDNYADWFKVLQVCKSNNIPFETFNEWSKTDKGYSVEENNKLWNAYKPNGSITIGSLKYLAKQDNPKAYELINLEVKKAQHYPIVQRLIKFLDNSAVCVSTARSRPVFYRLNQFGIFGLDENGSSIKRDLNGAFAEPYVNRRNELYDICKSATTDDRKILKKKIEKYEKWLDMLYNESQVNSIINMLANHLIDSKFIEKLDANPNILGFMNGVYDLSTMTFRKGTREDYCSMTVDYSFSEKPADRTEELMERFIEPIFPDIETREYCLNFMASCLEGLNKRQEFAILYGEEGQNGKSELMYLMEKVFGQYSVKCDVSLLTDKRVRNGAANELLMSIKGKRFVWFSEPSKGTELQKDVIKELVGTERISCRANYQKQCTFMPLCKMAVCTNEIPDLDGLDGGICRRIKVIPFISKFVKQDTVISADSVNVYHRDPLLREDLLDRIDVRLSFMHLLLKRFVDIKKIGFMYAEPRAVKDKTEEYFYDNDPVKRFVKEKLEFTNNLPSQGHKGDFVKMSDITNEYKNWCSVNSIKDTAGRKLMNELKKHMSGFVYNTGINKFNGWRFIQVRDIEEV